MIRMQISQEKFATFNYMPPAKQKSEEMTEVETEDSPYVRIIKNRLRSFIKTKIQIDPYHHIASFLTPKFRNLSYVKNDIDRKNLFDQIEEYIDEHSKSIEIIAESDPDPENDDENDLFNSVSDIQNPSSTLNRLTEFERYKMESFSNEELKMPAEQYWAEHHIIYPILYDLSLFILGIPTTSCTSERRFSDAGWVVNDRRCSLDPTNIEKLLFLKNNE